MKQIAYFLLLTAILGCRQQEHKQQSDESISNDVVKAAAKSDDTLKSIINENIHKQPVIDTVFLGFTFSMTKKEALNHFNRLVKEKKLFYNEKDQRYEYLLAMDVAKANASIAPEFQDNKLYKLTLVIAPADEISTDEMVYQQTALAYMKKYDSFTVFRQADLVNPSDMQYHWIKNNLHIFQHKTGEGTIVSYINMPVEQTLSNKEKSVADSATTQSQKDI